MQKKQVIAIFTKMNSAYALSTVTLKNEGVTEQEVAKLVNDLESFAGSMSILTGTVNIQWAIC